MSTARRVHAGKCLALTQKNLGTMYGYNRGIPENEAKVVK